MSASVELGSGGWVSGAESSGVCCFVGITWVEPSPPVNESNAAIAPPATSNTTAAPAAIQRKRPPPSAEDVAEGSTRDGAPPAGTSVGISVAGAVSAGSRATVAAASAGCCPTGEKGAPQFPQNREPSGSSLPQDAHVDILSPPAVPLVSCSAGANGAPQFPQNREPSGSSLPQDAQVTIVSRTPHAWDTYSCVSAARAESSAGATFCTAVLAEPPLRR